MHMSNGLMSNYNEYISFYSLFLTVCVYVYDSVSMCMQHVRLCVRVCMPCLNSHCYAWPASWLMFVSLYMSVGA